MKRSLVLGPLGFVLGVLALSSNVGNDLHVPVGGASGPLMMSSLGPSEAAAGLPVSEVTDDRRDFYFRPIESNRSEVSIPLRPQGEFSVALRMNATVRTRIDLSAGQSSLGRAMVPRGPWRRALIAEGIPRDRLRFTLDFRDAPLVGRSDPENFRRHVDEFVFSSDEGFLLPRRSRITGGWLVLILILICQVAALETAALVTILVGPVVLLAVSLQEPVALTLALPRLLGFVVLTALLIALLARVLKLPLQVRGLLALLGSAVVLVYGFISFLPKHSPADLDIHRWRTMDLASVPLSYDAGLRYGSHYPTESQIRGSAAEALGEGPKVPYSPLPYVLFYLSHAAGLNLHWSIHAIGAMSLALLPPLLFAFARAASSDYGGWLASVLFALDLATVHHLGRAHAPAVVGGAFGIAGLLAFGLALSRLNEPGRWKVPALFLGFGALGYSTTPLIYGLFGIALLALVLMQAPTKLLVRPLLLALSAGGVIALALYYGHYLPGLIRVGGNSELALDPFPGRTFFLFHNESRQSLRLWRLGLFIPYLAAIPAIYVVWTRCTVVVRSFLVAWVSAWAGIMLLKEPWVFPRLLRWAKEDFYVAPAVALVIAIAIARMESRAIRVGLTALMVTTVLVLRARDYGFHADTLRFLR